IRSHAPWQKGREFLPGQIVPHIPVKFTVSKIAGISFVCAPYLFGRLYVAAKEGEAARRTDRSVMAVFRTGRRVKDSVRFDHRVADALARQDFVVSRMVGALRQPKSLRVFLKGPAVLFDAGDDLRSDG